MNPHLAAGGPSSATETAERDPAVHPHTPEESNAIVKPGTGPSSMTRPPLTVGDSIPAGASDIPPEVLEVKSRPNATKGWEREGPDEWCRDSDVWPTAVVLAHAPLYVSKVQQPGNADTGTDEVPFRGGPTR